MTKSSERDRFSHYRAAVHGSGDDIPEPKRQGGNDGCDECGAPCTAVNATIVERNGGAFVRLCRDCQELLTSRCCRCGELKVADSRAEDIVIHDGGSAPICDDCRRSLITDGPAGGVPGWGELLADGRGSR
jgi:hypothetical protein